MRVKRTTGGSVECRHCGTLFRVDASRRRAGKDKFCSMACRSAASRTLASITERFWRFVDRSSDCWLWTSTKIAAGYGYFYVSGRHYRAHRFAYQLAYGEIAPGMVIMHLCNTPSCVRPDHLKAGSQSENIRQSVAEGRFAMMGDTHWKRRR